MERFAQAGPNSWRICRAGVGTCSKSVSRWPGRAPIAQPEVRKCRFRRYLGRMSRVALACIALIAGVCVGGAAARSSEPRELPIEGTTSSGTDWRLQAAKPSADGKLKSSWCLRLRYTTDVAVDGDSFTGGLKTCGRTPAARLSGAAVVDCAENAVFVFGAMRSAARRVRLRDSSGARTKPTLAALPAGSDFRGRSFIVAIETRALPAELLASRVGGSPVLRVPRRRKLCKRASDEPAQRVSFVEFQSAR